MMIRTEWAQPAYGPHSFLKKSPAEKKFIRYFVFVGELQQCVEKPTYISVNFFCEGLLSVIRSILIVPLSDLPNMCVHRNGLTLIQTHQTNTVCHLQQILIITSCLNICSKININKMYGSNMFAFCLTLVPTPGRVRRESRASRYGTFRKPTSHWGPCVSRICLALC